MKLLPYEKLVYTSDLAVPEIMHRLQLQTEPLQLIRINLFTKPSGKKFEGKVMKNSFKIQRIINYRNSFLPIINGKVESDILGSTINLVMQLNMFVKVFLIIWLSFAFIGLFSAISFSPQKEVILPALAISLGIILFLYVLTTWAFRYEVKKAKLILEDLLELNLSNSF